MNCSRTGLWGGRLGNRRLYPEPHRRPIAVWNNSERLRLGRSRCAGALVRQAKLGASCRVQVPAEQGLTNHSYRVWQLWRRHDVRPNKTVEAYTGNHVARRGDRTPQSLIQPRKKHDADGDGVNAPEAHTEGRDLVSVPRVCRGPP